MADNLLQTQTELPVVPNSDPTIAPYTESEKEVNPFDGIVTRYDVPVPPPEEGTISDAFSVVGAAFRRENLLVSSLQTAYEEGKPPIDQSYDWYNHRDELIKDLPQEFHLELSTADSLAEAEQIRIRMLDDLEDRQLLHEAGGYGVAAQLAAGILSPENLIPVGGALNWANKAGRLKSAMQTGALVSGMAGGAEAVLASQNYTKDGEDIIYAATFGLALGGGLGAVLAKGTPAPKAATVDAAVDTTIPRATDDIVTPQAFGPPQPTIITRTTEEAIQRRTGPIDVNTHVKVNKLHEQIGNLNLAKASRKVRESLAKSFTAIDHRAALDSETAAKLDEIYEVFDFTPTTTVTTTERVVGDFKQLQTDMAFAARELRNDMDVRLVTESVMDDAGAMRNRDVQDQLVETTLKEDDLIDNTTDWAKEFKIDKKLKEDKTNVAAVMNKITASDYTRLINHPSSVVKRIAYDLLEGGTGTLGRTRTAAMYKDMYERRILSKGLIPLNEQYAVWAKQNNLNFFQRNFFTDGYDRFYGDVRRVLEDRTVGRQSNDVHPAVLEAADRWDEMMDHALDIGKSSGWEALQDIPKRSGYVPLTWKGQNILKHGKARSIKLISKGYQSVGLDVEMANVISNAVVKRSLDTVTGVDTNLAGLLEKNQRGQLKTALEGIGLGDVEINSFLKKLDAREAKAGPKFTKARTKIDLNMSDGEISLIDLVDNDLNAIASKYARDVAGRSAMAKKGFTNDAIWRNWKSAALKDNERVLATGGDDDLAQHLDDVKSYFTSTPIAGGINKNMRRLMQSTTLSALGMVGAAQLAEIGTVVGRLGLRAAIKHLPAVNEVATLATKAKGSNDVLDELRPLLGDFDYDHLLYRPDVQIDDKISAVADFGTFGKVVDKVLGKGNTALGYASGMNTIRHFEHRMAARMMINKFAGLAADPTKIEKSLARMEDIGLDAKELKRVTTAIQKHAEFDDKGTLTKLNLTKWGDGDVQEAFVIAINRHTAQVVQRQLAGETSAWMHKSIGAMMTQFRHFPIVAFEKQLLRNLRHHDQEAASTLMYGFAASYGVQAIKAAISGRDISDHETMIKQTVNYMGMASIIPDAGTLLAQAGILPDELNFRKLGHTGSHADKFDIVDYVPVAGQVNKLGKAAALPFKAARGDASSADIRAGLSAIPLSNTVFSKAMMELMLED